MVYYQSVITLTLSIRNKIDFLTIVQNNKTRLGLHPLIAKSNTLQKQVFSHVGVSKIIFSFGNFTTTSVVTKIVGRFDN